MIRKLSATVAAGALMAAGPAMADPNTNDPVNFDAEVEVQQIATLDVVQDTASMVIDDTSDTFQGQPSSTGSQFNASTGNLAVLKLSTNFKVDAVEIDFPTDTGFGPPDSSVNDDEFGVAKNGEDEELGVFPQAGVLNSNDGIIGGGGGIFLHSGNDEPIKVTGETRGDTSGFEPGVHRIGVGVSTSWNRDKVDSETEFADPGTYTISMTASIVPSM